MSINNCRPKRSLIFTLDRDSLQKLFDENNTYSDIMEKIGYNNLSNNYTTLRRAIKDFTIDLSKFKENNKKFNKEKTIDRSYASISYEELIEKTTSRNTIKKYIINKDLIQYKCAECPNEGFHNGKELSLQLDHIDGNTNNNELINLRFLCPNCHSQTNTFGSRNGKYIVTPSHKCNTCDKRLFNNTKHGMCRDCYLKTEIQSNILSSISKPRPRIFEIDKSELEQLIKEKSLTEIGRLFCVSDNAVRKRCKFFKIDISTRKFSKKTSGK